MDFRLMKFVDKYAGWLLCALLSFAGLFLKLFRKKTQPTPPRKILVMKFWGMGSIILSTPLLQALKTKFPDSKIYFLTLSRNEEIVKMFEPVNEVITLDIDHGPAGFLMSFVKIVAVMRGIKLDILLDLEFFTRFSAIVTYLSGAKERIGFKAWEAWRGQLHTIGVPFNRYWHVAQNFYNLGRAAGIPEEKNLVLLQPKPAIDVNAEMKTIFSRFNLESGKYICINPNAGEIAMTRRWPKDNFTQLTKNILSRSKDLKIAYIGNSKESGYIDSIISGLDKSRVINTAGTLNISQLIVLFKNSKLLISNDSGPLHLAVALKTPTISFFGPETPVLYAPSGDKNIVFFKNLDCSPCINVHEDKTFRCDKKSPACLEDITVGEVWNKLEKLI
ncbi:MAG: glycosyltransferase family 9 protein [Elusimicrobiota bacterium]